MSRLLRVKRAAQRNALNLKISIPGKVAPLFNALAVIMDLDQQAFAVWAICKGITCEEALNKFDELVNALL